MANPLDLIRALFNQGVQAPQLPEQDGPEINVARSRPYDHRGMFGLRGTPRNILGVLGDAFLVQGNRDPMYAPRRQREREADAMRGFTEDPIAAAGRLNQYNPEGAREFYNETRQQERLGRAAQTEYEQHHRDIAARMIRTGTAENWGELLPQVRRYLGIHGIDYPVNIPDQYPGDEGRNSLGSLAIPVDRQVDDDRIADYQSERLLDYDEDRAALMGNREEQDEDRDDVEEIRRTDPRRVSPNQAPRTPDALASQLILRAQRGENLNPRERQYLNWWRTDRQSRRGRGRRAPPSGGGTPQTRRRVVNGATIVERNINGRWIRIQ